MKKYVLVTGASRGIGLAIVKLLAQSGFVVFAGVRKFLDLDKLSELDNIKPILLNVDDLDSVQAAFEEVSAITNNLFAIINNAGFSLIEPMENVVINELEKQFSTNTFGSIRVIQKFLPLLNKSKIISISSFAADLILPFAAPYCASKKALEILLYSFDLEQANKNIQTIVVKPGVVNTDIWIKEIGAQNTAYSEIVGKIYKLMEFFAEKGQTPENFAEFILRILNKKSPQKTYHYGLDAKILNIFKFLIPTFVRLSLKLLKGSKSC